MAIVLPDETEVPDVAGEPEAPLLSDETLTQEAPAPVVDDELVVVDVESMTLINTISGEVVGYADTPPEELEGVALAEWIGEKRTWHKGQAAALQAEKQVWLDTISKRFDARIKRHESAVKWFETTYYQFLFDLAKRIIGEAKKRSAVVGMLILQLRKTSASTEVLDTEKALGWLEGAGLTEAIKTTRTVLVSKLPDELKTKLVKPSNQAKTGLAFHPGGEDELKFG